MVTFITIIFQIVNLNLILTKAYGKTILYFSTYPRLLKAFFDFKSLWNQYTYKIYGSIFEKKVVFNNIGKEYVTNCIKHIVILLIRKFYAKSLWTKYLEKKPQ